MSAIVEKMEGNLYVIICNNCVYYNREKGMACKAFPERIPDIIFDTNKHDTVIEGQEGNYVFKMEK